MKNRIDEENIGVIGHSLGGSAITGALVKDDRIKAGFNMDGRVYENVKTLNFNKPFMHMINDAIHTQKTTQADIDGMGDVNTTLEDMNEHQELFIRSFNETFDNQSKDAYKIELRGTNHYSFSDLFLMIKLLAPELDVTKGHTIINDATIAFFDKYLKGKEVDIKSELGKYEEVNMEAK